MPRRSRQWVEKTIWETINQNFREVFASLDKNKLENFIDDFLTKEEKVMVTKRLALYTMLLNNYSENEIKEILKLSHETIRSGRQLLETKSSVFKNSLANKMTKKQPNNRFLEALELALKSKSDVKARAKLLSGDY